MTNISNCDGDKFYQLCNRYKPRMRPVLRKDENGKNHVVYELESTNEEVLPVTELDIEFVKLLNDN